MTDYKQTLLLARNEPNSAMIEQLVTLLGYDGNVNAKMILDDIYTGQQFDYPSFRKIPSARRKVLDILVNAMAMAKDRRAIEECLVVFLNAANVQKIDLTVPEAGVRIWIEWHAGAIKYSWGEVTGTSRRPKTETWEEEMKVIIPAIQKWCRETLDKRTSSTEPPAAG